MPLGAAARIVFGPTQPGWNVDDRRVTHRCHLHVALACIESRLIVPSRRARAREEFPLSTVLVKQLIEAGVHFGHRASRWNPKMRPYIYGRRNLIHIIDVRETVRGLIRARKYLSQVAAQQGLILFVGCKRQAAETVQRESERCNMAYVNDRWLGGTLTNFRTIRSRLTRLEQLEDMRKTEEILKYSKKMQSALNREYRKMFRNLNGIRSMNRLPECMVVIDPRKEKNAISEARKLGITTLALIDTDCDPDLVDLPIPGNDDSIRSIEIVMQQLANAVIEGKQNSKDLMPASHTAAYVSPEGADKDAE
ncbi:MAG: 30S ribosomal protein S2 [Planctomycetes bacterium]|nr:30S ribosomal protein S2 [Planctomycetota bacterium]